ncbi:MAG: 50S ribosomal protein L1 [Gammaproteobacteria bacterium]|jgi:large subunit ribosomal protein L1
MVKLTKRMQKIREAVNPGVYVNAKEAFETLKKLSSVKFIESVDVSVNLGIDTKKSDQAVRGAIMLPHGTGREVKVAVFTQAANADAAKKAGADIVGFDDLATAIKEGKTDFDVLIATPDAMSAIGKLGPILGPKGLMPNPKDGTVTTDIATAVKNAKTGQVRFRSDKGGIVHCRIGTVKFTEQNLKENLQALVVALNKAKPSSSKGIYLKKITVSTTMGPGISVDLSSLEV